jgi:hypothetical protein
MMIVPAHEQPTATAETAPDVPIEVLSGPQRIMNAPTHEREHPAPIVPPVDVHQPAIDDGTVVLFEGGASYNPAWAAVVQSGELPGGVPPTEREARKRYYSLKGRANKPGTSRAQRKKLLRMASALEVVLPRRGVPSSSPVDVMSRPPVDVFAPPAGYAGAGPRSAVGAVAPTWEEVQAYQANLLEAQGEHARAAFIRRAAGLPGGAP